MKVERGVYLARVALQTQKQTKQDKLKCHQIAGETIYNAGFIAAAVLFYLSLKRRREGGGNSADG